MKFLESKGRSQCQRCRDLAAEGSPKRLTYFEDIETQPSKSFRSPELIIDTDLLYTSLNFPKGVERLDSHRICLNTGEVVCCDAASNTDRQKSSILG